MDQEVFWKYLNKDSDFQSNCIKNYKNKRLIFLEEIDGKKYYIKKYILPGWRGKMLAIGLREDKTDKNIRISRILEEIGVMTAKIIFTAKKRYSLLQTASILVMEDSGKPLDTFAAAYQEHLPLFQNFFNLFVTLCKHKIFPDDYSFENVLVTEEKKLCLLDLDEYKIRK
jgi:tRNA A-37 threonylcarbamoyl transferase component Bud32